MGERSTIELMNLSGRAALVAGGAGHIGSAVSRALVELGASVAVCDLDETSCDDQATRLNALRAESAVAVSADLADEASARAAVGRTLEQLGRLDILVHCAALVGSSELAGWAVPFEEQTVEAWDAALRVNLTSAFVLAQEAGSALAEHGAGSIILFGSTYGLVGPDPGLYAGTTMGNPAGYGATKGGALQLMRHLATTLAPRVRVNAISPGGLERGQPAVFVERYNERTPLRRMAAEEDLKGAVAYLASDLSAYVTGHNLVVDGGWTAW